MNYNFDVKIETEHFTVQVDTAAKYGYFENTLRGDFEVCLWFCSTGISGTSTTGNTCLELSDYDGAYELPKEVCQALDGYGFIVPSEFWPDELILQGDK